MNFHLKLILAWATLTMPVATLLATDEATTPIDVEITRFLQEVQFVHAYKHGIEVAVAQQGRSNAMLTAIMAAPDDKIINAVLPAYRLELTMAQAHALADFYASDAGKALLRQQVNQLGDPNPLLVLTNEQRAAVAQFMASDTGKEAAHMGRREFMIEVSQYMAKAFGAKAP